MEQSHRATALLAQLRRMGFELHIDDFGTGYSSLSYLRRLPVNMLKIDRSFVSQMGEDAENAEIVRTIVQLARNLRMEVMAEGVETVEQLDHLKSLQCGYGQGDFFSRAVDGAAAARLITQSRQ